jgi:beta-lactamase regulating signal transducer with metallopeptidase domain
MSPVDGQNHGDQYLEGHLVGKSFSFVNRGHIFPVAFTPFLTFLFLACYAAFFFWRTFRIGSSLLCTLKFRQSAYPRDLPAPLTEITKRYAKAFAIRDVAILCSSDAVSPVTLSLPRPVLILPERFLVDISESDFSSAVCHELAHIRRHDFLLNLFCELVSVPVSFHPGLLWIKKRIALTRELACDEAAATKLASRSNYARSLLSLAQSISLSLSKAQSNAALGLFDSNTLEERIMNLLRKPNRMSRKGVAVLAVVASSLFTVASVGISAFSLRAAPSANVSGDVRQFVGTWTAVHEDTPYLILELHS